MVTLKRAQTDDQPAKNADEVSSRVMISTWLKRMIMTGPSGSMVPVRLVLGIIFFIHGSQKLLGWFGGKGLIFSAQIFEAPYGLRPGLLWAFLAGLTEFYGALLVLSGLLTRLGALGLAVVMAIAICKVHLGSFFNPEGVEFPLALLGACLALVIYGGGRWSIDHTLLRPPGARDDGAT
jgi:putative oxidoreductase